MPTGDRTDMMARMRAVLPARWFPDDAPVLDSVLAGLGDVWASVFGVYSFLVPQLRISTATGSMLDLISRDFFDADLLRRSGESDAALRARIIRELFRECGTRTAAVRVLTDLVDRTPIVFEPAYPHDTGGYGEAGSGVCNGLAYGVAGGYGSLRLPFEFFISGIRGSRSTIANVMGYYAGSGWAGGGYGVGAFEYASISWTEGQITDADMFAAINGVRPAATIAWMRIVDTSPWVVAPDPVTGLAIG